MRIGRTIQSVATHNGMLKYGPHGLAAIYKLRKRHRTPRCNLLKLDSLPTQSCRRPRGLRVDLIERHGVGRLARRGRRSRVEPAT